MKVKITHTVDIEDVSEFINDIIINCRQSLSDEAKNLKYYTGDLIKLLSNITNVRASLNLLDSQLEDVLNMASGLESVRSSTHDPELTEEGEEPNESKS